MPSQATQAFIVSQGEELLTGQTVDTNANFLAEQLTDLGLRVRGAATAGDRVDAIARTFVAGVEGVDVVVSTGGLGPTGDDLTAEGIAAAFGRELVLNPEALEQVRQRYQASGRAMAPCNERQAMLPKGARPIPNPLGTAPGFALVLEGGCRIYCMPGVPHEMRRMWLDSVRPELDAELVLLPPQRHLFRTLGKGESQLQDLLEEIPTSFPGVELGFRARMPENQVKLAASSDCPSFSGAVERCRELLGRDCFSEDAEVSLAATVGRLLEERSERLALAESCTGGWIGHLCVTEPGSSAWFERGIVSYSNEAKMELLGVREESLLDHGAVSSEVALEMAHGVSSRSGAEWGLSVTGIAGPTGGSADKPVGTVHLAVAGPGVERSRHLYLPTGDRTATRRLSAFVALDLLRRQILRL